MKIIVAGAGAGKTTSMAQKVLDRLNEITDGKIVYVITYTNAARNCIRDKIIELNGSLPKQLLIETSHAFLLREFIFPFHHLLYEQQYSKASQIKLPDNHVFKALKIKELRVNKIMHVEKVTETAKWIVSQKSGDKISIKRKREKILAIISRYLDSVFIDEAEDIDDHILKIIEVLNANGTNICLVGDPKQDLRGRNTFKQMVLTNKQHVEYIIENYRCPILHVNLSNLYISDEEKQIPQKTEDGQIGFIFESTIDVANYIEDDNWDYLFIYKKNARYRTNANSHTINEQNLSYELKSIVMKADIKENEVDKYVYVVKKAILKRVSSKSNFWIFNKLEEFLNIKLIKQDKGKLGQALDFIRENPIVDGLLVNSIDSVKGLEGERCIFILTPDLAAYLFKEKKEQNKMMNYLYVALTRSKKDLLILVTKEVENNHGKESIESSFSDIGISIFN